MTNGEDYPPIGNPKYKTETCPTLQFRERTTSLTQDSGTLIPTNKFYESSPAVLT
jgi:hypothetical protein